MIRGGSHRLVATKGTHIMGTLFEVFESLNRLCSAKGRCFALTLCRALQFLNRLNFTKGLS